MNRTFYQLIWVLLVAGLLPAPMVWAQSGQTSAQTVALRNRGIFRSQTMTMDAGCGCAAPAPAVAAPSCGCDAAISCCIDPCCLLSGVVRRIGSTLDCIFRCEDRCGCGPAVGRAGGRAPLLGRGGCGCGAAPVGCGSGGSMMPVPGAIPMESWQEGENVTPPTPPAQEAYRLWNMPTPQSNVRASGAPVLAPTPAQSGEGSVTISNAKVTRASYNIERDAVTKQQIPSNPLR